MVKLEINELENKCNKKIYNLHKKIFAHKLRDKALYFLHHAPVISLHLPINSTNIEFNIEQYDFFDKFKTNKIVALYWKFNNIKFLKDIAIGIKLNNNTKRCDKDIKYYLYAQPFHHLLLMPEESICMYSFALRPTNLENNTGHVFANKILFEFNDFECFNDNSSIDIEIQYYMDNFIEYHKFKKQCLTNLEYLINFIHSLKTTNKFNIFDKLNSDLICEICNYLF